MTTHLEVDVPSLSATNGPLSLDDDDGNPVDAIPAGFLDLVFHSFDILIRAEVCNSLA